MQTASASAQRIFDFIESEELSDESGKSSDLVAQLDLRLAAERRSDEDRDLLLCQLIGDQLASGNASVS